MGRDRVFGAVRAASVATLLAGAGLVIGGCGEPTAKTKTKPDAKPAAPAALDGDKPAGEKNCGADKTCSPGACGKK